MRPVRGRVELLHEVDEARWVSPGEARRLLSYDRDRTLVDSLDA
jgi:hypothetical protein